MKTINNTTNISKEKLASELRKNNDNYYISMVENTSAFTVRKKRITLRKHALVSVNKEENLIKVSTWLDNKPALYLFFFIPYIYVLLNKNNILVYENIVFNHIKDIIEKRD